MTNYKETLFWEKINKKIKNKSVLTEYGCREWVGCRDRDGYGVKRVTWPDGAVKLERTHRLVYMMTHGYLRDTIPRLDARGLGLEVSHLCHSRACVEPSHLTLEAHHINISRHLCLEKGYCTKEHAPDCILRLARITLLVP